MKAHWQARVRPRQTGTGQGIVLIAGLEHEPPKRHKPFAPVEYQVVKLARQLRQFSPNLGVGGVVGSRAYLLTSRLQNPRRT